MNHFPKLAMRHLLKQSIIHPDVFLFDIFWSLAAQPSTIIVRVSFTVVRLLFNAALVLLSKILK